jgi:hypothetical protein
LQEARLWEGRENENNFAGGGSKLSSIPTVSEDQKTGLLDVSFARPIGKL